MPELNDIYNYAMNKRVSAFVYLYRVLRQDWPPARAEPDLCRIWQPDPIWRRFMDMALSAKWWC